MKITKLHPPQNNSYVLDELPFRALTLFGALANCHTYLFGSNSFDQFLALFDAGKISSIFPGLTVDGKDIFFLPRPFLGKEQTETFSDKEIFSKKKNKKIRWLSTGAMQNLGKTITEKNGEFYHRIDFNNDFCTIGNEFLILKDELDPEILARLSTMPIYQKDEIMKVSVPRWGDDSVPFTQKEISFTDEVIQCSGKQLKIKAFIYFFDDVVESENWIATKQLLADEGIGGKRSLGKGFFDAVETNEIPMEISKHPKLYLLLSNLIPRKEELRNILSYETGVDDGFITFGCATTEKKDTVFYLKEGSIIRNNIIGTLLPQPFKESTIYRYGKALLFPLGGMNE